MSGSDVIGRVSLALRRLLKDNMATSLNAEVTVLSPDQPGSAAQKRVNLFLYRIQENAHLKEMDWQPKRGYPGQLEPPPLSLNLFYLLTAYADSSSPDGNSTAHALLGEAMRVIYENPVVPQDYLTDDPQQAAREKVKIMMSPMNMEELSRVWSTFGKPFRPSVMYEISVVQIDQREHERPLARRVEKIGAPVVVAPFIPPALDHIEPLRGPAGTSITVFGEHLAGWRASARLAGKQILEIEKLMADAVELTVPPELSPGLYELQIDVAHLCRRTFFFEVVGS